MNGGGAVSEFFVVIVLFFFWRCGRIGHPNRQFAEGWRLTPTHERAH